MIFKITRTSFLSWRARNVICNCKIRERVKGTTGPWTTHKKKPKMRHAPRNEKGNRPLFVQSRTRGRMSCFRCSLIFSTWLLITIVPQPQKPNRGFDKTSCSTAVSTGLDIKKYPSWSTRAAIFEMYGRTEIYQYHSLRSLHDSVRRRYTGESRASDGCSCCLY